MKFTDIIELAKKGYTPNDIRELLAIEVPEETDAKPNEVSSESVKVAHDDAQAEEHTEEVEKPEMELDAATEEINKLKKEIEKLQAANTRRERPAPEPKKSNKEILEDMARRFM
ncbi:MAG: hypothetical protein J6S12_01990 [Alphaproteobacteria bacterium]|nr:hypothetical protein [Alphaproteobacteria bacterium]